MRVKSGQRVGMTLPPSENVEASTSRNPKGLHDVYRDNFTFFYLYIYKMKLKATR
jgi:hypothetical protein